MTAITGLVMKNRAELKKQQITNIPSIKTEEISIVIPVKNNQHGIDNLLESIFVCQKKKDYPKEIIVVDNNEKLRTKIRPQFLEKGVEIKLFHCKRAAFAYTPCIQTAFTVNSL